MGPGAYFAPTWPGKGTFLNLPRSTSASGYKHYKCRIIMLQCRIRGRGTGKAGEWEALTQGTQGKRRKICCSLPTASFSPVFALRVAAKLYDFTKIKMGSIGGLADFFPPNIGVSNCAFPFSPCQSCVSLP